MGKVNTENAKGSTYAILAFLVWGLLPLYWKQIKDIPADESIALRAIWFFIVVFVLLIVKKQVSQVMIALKNKKQLIIGFCAALMVATNWFVFVYAVNTDNVIQVSMGYYMTPLVAIFLGRVIYKEKLDFWQKIALVSALIGVIILTLKFDGIPWISLILAVAFALYGLLKKMTQVAPIVGLGIETTLLIPLAIIYIVFKDVQSQETLKVFSDHNAWLVPFSGLVTAVPLLLFSAGARRIKLSTLGFLQYIYPTTSLFVGVLIFKEPFSREHIISFSFIWLGLIIYSMYQVKSNKIVVKDVA